MHATFFVVYYSCFSVRNDSTYAPLRDEIRKWLWFQTSSRWFHVDWRSRYRFEKSWWALRAVSTLQRSQDGLKKSHWSYFLPCFVALRYRFDLALARNFRQTEKNWTFLSRVNAGKRHLQRSNQFPNNIHQKCRKWFSLCFRSLRLTLELLQILFICSVVLRELWPS